ncbi:DsbA family protein [Paenibacillus apiarius]|uniref:thioredoxin domain-containing protein n=1 Tax=Paenibacillus apiarius TaxID=46240 RepID=UPI002282F9A7|nr:thioredoxin domain-containing protein [Paenibacillus apiarius]MCY9515620.1 DsbA family protein [Paenibacillus apiarius]MCY9558965.1 DsbA family protein [Paenibacillus apiarius]MCY9730001.1 DsbA family protein [Paenibacillus apiarius]MCY9794010.1 DsbA family protein [Paenibacillus apiarius]MEC0118045.1 thioredoxin domain-containing protein [Paenibacillus apiarius]
MNVLAKSSSRKSKKGNERMFLIMLPIAIIVLLGIIFVLNRQGEKIKTDEMVNKPAVEFNLEGQPTLGSKDAKVSVVEFGDYKCPACKIWTEEVYPKLKADFVDTGKVSFTFVNKLVIPKSELAAEAAEEVFRQNPESFWTYHHELYTSQQNEQKDWVTVPFLVDLAKRVVPEVDLGQLEKALNDRTMQGKVAGDEEMAHKAGVSGTPTVFVNGKEFTGEWDNYSQLKEFIETALNEAK